MVESSSLSVLNSRNVVDSTLCFVRTADDVERATSLRTDASIMVGVRMLVLILSSTPEIFSDTSMSLSLRRLHFVLHGVLSSHSNKLVDIVIFFIHIRRCFAIVVTSNCFTIATGWLTGCSS